MCAAFAIFVLRYDDSTDPPLWNDCPEPRTTKANCKSVRKSQKRVIASGSKWMLLQAILILSLDPILKILYVHYEL